MIIDLLILVFEKIFYIVILVFKNNVIYMNCNFFIRKVYMFWLKIKLMFNIEVCVELKIFFLVFFEG